MKSSNTNGNESVTAQVRVAAVIPLPSPLRRRRHSIHSDHAQYVTPQRLAFCETSGVIAIANGPVVDLYLVNSSTSATASTSSSIKHSEHSGVHIEAESCKHLPFLMQIALDEYKDIRGYAQKSSAGDEQSVMPATCVCFVAPGVLLVGAAKLQDEQVAVEPPSTWLFGFRVYVNESVLHRKSEAFLGNSRSHPQEPAMVQLSFLERILLPKANGIASLQVCRHCTNMQSGAVVMLLNNSNSFGVFQWRERFSDRQVCVAELPDCDTALVAAAMSSDGRWCALSDAVGYLYLLNFETFEWFGTSTDHRQHQTVEDKQPPATLLAKRLRNGSCSRSGILMRDNPLDSVRLASVSGDLRPIRNKFLANWFPTLLDERHDRQVLGPESRLQWFQQTQAMKWPSIKEFFEFPTISLSSGQSVEGVFAISQPSSRLWGLLPASMDERNREDWDGWMVVKMTETSLQLLVMETQPQPSVSHPDLLLAAGAGRTDIEEQQVLGDRRSEDGKESRDTAADYPQDTEQEDEKREMSVVTTIQEKYRLPQPSWNADLHSESEKEIRGPQVAEDRGRAPPGKEVRFDRNTKMATAEYDQRVQMAAERVERLSSNFKMLRNSFQLFTQDVQSHMSDISEQLELAARLRHSRDPRGRQSRGD